MRRIWIVFLIAGIVLIAVAAFQHLMRLGKGDPAPLFALPSMESSEVALEGYRGRPVIVHFFATWCGPCQAEFPALNQFQSDFEAKGLAVLAIAEDEDLNALKGFVDYMKPVFPVLVDSDAAVAESYRSYAVPETYLVDPEGTILWRHTGPVEWNDERVRNEIAGLIN